MTKKIPYRKLGSLFRLLASNHDHEVLSAVAAIKRTLSAHGADINDMADTFENLHLVAGLAGRTAAATEEFVDMLREMSRTGPIDKGFKKR